jgi:hypothetical protein
MKTTLNDRKRVSPTDRDVNLPGLRGVVGIRKAIVPLDGRLCFQETMNALNALFKFD